MQLLPIHTGLLAPGDDLISLLQKENLMSGDILVLSSKAVATAENTLVNLATRTISDDAKTWSEKTGRTPTFCQAALEEIDRMHGTILGSCQGAILAELKPNGLRHGTILAPNAGLDESNVPHGYAVGWPLDLVASALLLFEAFEKNVGIVISDSSCRARRWGVTAYALTVAGFNPLRDERGSKDLYDRTLRVTKEATADQLATAANMLMGNADQAIPAVIIRNHGIPLNDFVGWVDGIEREEDLFRDIL